MRYLFDTNILIYISKRRPAEVGERFSQLRPGDAGMSVVSYLELIFGAQKSGRSKEALERVEKLEQLVPVLPLDKSAAHHYGLLRMNLEQKGTPIGAFDMLIAAHALALGLILVTNNTREFARVSGLRLQNWAAGS